MRRQLLQCRIRQRDSGLEIMLGAEGIIRRLIFESKLLRRDLKHFQTLGDDFFPDEIAGHDCDFHCDAVLSTEHRLIVILSVLAKNLASVVGARSFTSTLRMTASGSLTISAARIGCNQY